MTLDRMRKIVREDRNSGFVARCFDGQKNHGTFTPAPFDRRRQRSLTGTLFSSSWGHSCQRGALAEKRSAGCRKPPCGWYFQGGRGVSSPESTPARPTDQTWPQSPAEVGHDAAPVPTISKISTARAGVHLVVGYSVMPHQKPLSSILTHGMFLDVLDQDAARA